MPSYSIDSNYFLLPVSHDNGPRVRREYQRRVKSSVENKQYKDYLRPLFLDDLDMNRFVFILRAFHVEAISFNEENQKDTSFKCLYNLIFIKNIRTKFIGATKIFKHEIACYA